MSGHQPKLHALIIGVNYYIRDPTYGDESLWGCVGDATRLRDHVKSYLDAQEAVRGSPAGSITFLTSTAKGPYNLYYNARYEEVRKVEGPVEQVENLPTYHNIVKELLKLCAKVKEGDTVLFSYSGHGNRWPTIVSDWAEKTSESALDEILCPYDLSIEGLGIRDWELNWLLGRIANVRGVKLTVFLDCCHSGGATREAKPPPNLNATHESESSENGPPLPLARVFRAQSDAGTAAESYGISPGSRTVNIENFYKDSKSPLLEHIVEIKTAWTELMSASNINSRTAGALGTSPRAPPMNYSCYTGCLAHELSWEFGDSGALTGATVSSLAILSKLPPAVVSCVSMRNMYRYIFDVVYRIRYRRQGLRIVQQLYQTPLLLGPNGGQFPGLNTGGAEFVPTTPNQEEFAKGLVPLHVRWNVNTATEDRYRPVESPPGLFLRAGNAHGVVKGSVYGVWLWYENPEVGSVPAVRVVVTDVRKVVSVVQPLAGTELPTHWKDLFDLEKEFLSPPKEGLYPWPSGCVARLIERPIPTTIPGPVATPGTPNWSCAVRLIGNVEGVDQDDYSPGVLPVTFSTSETQSDFTITATSATTPDLYVLKDETDGTQPIRPTTLADCVEAARHIAHYKALLALGDGQNPLRNAFRLSLNPSPTERRDGYTYVTFEWAANPKVNPTYTPHANISLFHFSGAPHYSIRKIYPQDGGFESLDDGEKISPDRKVRNYFGSKRNIGFKGTGGVIKAIVTFSSSVFDSWELGPLEEIAIGGNLNKRRLGDIVNATAGGPTVMGKDEDQLWYRFDYWCTLKL